MSDLEEPADPKDLVEVAQEPSAKKPFDELFALIERLPDPEAKLTMAIDHMEQALAQTGAPQFKLFWDLRKVCLEAFKSPISPVLRGKLWTRYRELLGEARRLKEILDEQASFAVEQIEIAIKALEADLDQLPQLLEKSPPVEFPVRTKALAKHLSNYQKFQGELALLNACAGRINALRKELIKTEMRVRQKNLFFQRLSVAGDRVFPRRKELIKELSDHFVKDVEAFIQESAAQTKMSDGVRFVREEIQALQTMAKVLTLNTHSFTQTRKRLSESWDKLKEADKELKRERAEKKAVSREGAEKLHAQIGAFKESFQKGDLTHDAAQKQIDQLFSQLRSTEFSYDDLKTLREELRQAKQLLLDKARAAEDGRRQQEQEKERSRQAIMEGLRTRVEQLLTDVEQLEAEQLTEKRDQLLQDIENALATRSEKQELERRLKSLRDRIAEKKERALLALSTDDQHALQQLRELLKERLALRQEIKQQLEIYRKAGGASGFDIAQALLASAQQTEERERLERVNQGISEIEQKIKQFQKKK